MGLRFANTSGFNIGQLAYGFGMMQEMAPYQQDINDSQDEFAKSPILSYKANDWATQRQNYETSANRMLDLKLKDLRHTNEFHSFGRRLNEVNAVQQTQQGLMDMDIQNFNNERALQYKDAQYAMNRQQNAIQGQMQGLLSPMNYQMVDTISQQNSPIRGIMEPIGMFGNAYGSVNNLIGEARNRRGGQTPGGFGGGFGGSAGAGASMGGSYSGGSSGFGGSLSGSAGASASMGGAY